jgi:hypothetical protein
MASATAGHQPETTGPANWLRLSVLPHSLEFGQVAMTSPSRYATFAWQAGQFATSSARTNGIPHSMF